MAKQIEGKPSWADAPKWAQWLAQDESGVWYWFSEKPRMNSQHNIHLVRRGDCRRAGSGKRNPKWRSALEQRPNPAPDSPAEQAAAAREEDAADRDAFNRALEDARRELGLPPWTTPHEVMFRYVEHALVGPRSPAPRPSDAVQATLQERGRQYGEFADHAAIAQRLQDTMRDAPGWQRLAPDQRQALTTIADKIARILNGDPDYLDNWHDMQGYARLVEDRLKRGDDRG